MKKTKILTLALMGLALGASVSSCNKATSKMSSMSDPSKDDGSGGSSSCNGPEGCGKSSYTNNKSKK